MEILELKSISEMNKIHWVILTESQIQQKKGHQTKNNSRHLTESKKKKDFQNNTLSFRDS